LKSENHSETTRTSSRARAGGVFKLSGEVEGKIWGSRIRVVVLAVVKNLGFCCKLRVRHVAKEFIMTWLSSELCSI